MTFTGDRSKIVEALTRNYSRAWREPSTGWRTRSACSGPGVDPDIFFSNPYIPMAERKRRIREAAAICSRCPVSAQCRDFAENEGVEYGIWAGYRYFPRRTADEPSSKPVDV